MTQNGVLKLDKLPYEVLLEIFQNLTQEDRVNFLSINKTVFYQIIPFCYKECKPDPLYPNINFIKYGKFIKKLSPCLSSYSVGFINNMINDINQYLNPGCKIYLTQGGYYNYSHFIVLNKFIVKKFHLGQTRREERSNSEVIYNILKLNLLREVEEVYISLDSHVIEESFLKSLPNCITSLHLSGNLDLNSINYHNYILTFTNLTDLSLSLEDNLFNYKAFFEATHTNLQNFSIISIMTHIYEDDNNGEILCLNGNKFPNLKSLILFPGFSFEFRNEFKRLLKLSLSLKANIYCKSFEWSSFLKLKELDHVEFGMSYRPEATIPIEEGLYNTSNLELDLSYIQFTGCYFSWKIFPLLILCKNLIHLSFHDCKFKECALKYMNINPSVIPLSIEYLEYGYKEAAPDFIAWISNNSPNLSKINCFVIKKRKK